MTTSNSWPIIISSGILNATECSILLVPESTHSSMESTLFLRNAPLPSVPLQRISSPVNLSAARVTVPNFSLNHLTLLLVNNSLPRPLRHDFSPIVCALNKFSKHSTNDEGDNKIVRGSVGASLVMACVLGIISCGCWMSPIANAIPPWSSNNSSRQTVAADSQKYKQTRQNRPDVEALKVSFSSFFSYFYYEVKPQLVLLYAQCAQCPAEYCLSNFGLNFIHWKMKPKWYRTLSISSQIYFALKKINYDDLR